MIPVYELSHSGTRGSPALFQDQGALTDVLTIQTREALKAKANTIQLKFSNPKRTDGSFKFTDRFQAEDEITVKLGKGLESGKDPVGTNIVMNALVKEWNYDVDSKGRFLGVKGNDLISKFLDKIVVFPYEANTLTAKELVEQTIGREYNDMFPNEPEKQLDLSKMAEVGTDPDTGALFKIPETIASENRTIRDIIDEVSIDSRTRNGNYVYWIERSANGTLFFRWEPKSTTIDRQIDGDRESLSFRPNKSAYDIKNYLHINAGEDDNGNSIQVIAANFDSIAEIGWKEDVWPYPDATRQARQKGLTGNDLITKAKELAIVEGETRLSALSNPRWKADVMMRGTTEFNLGNNIYLASSGLGGDWLTQGPINAGTGLNFVGKKLRIDSITNKLSEKGWTTTLGLKEDTELGVI